MWFTRDLCVCVLSLCRIHADCKCTSNASAMSSKKNDPNEWINSVALYCGILFLYHSLASSYCALLNHIVSDFLGRVPNHVISYHISSHCISLFCTVSAHIVLSYISCCIISCLVSHCIMLYNVVSCWGLIGSYCLVLLDILSNLNKSGLLVLYSIRPCHVMLHVSNVVLSYYHAITILS